MEKVSARSTKRAVVMPDLPPVSVRQRSPAFNELSTQRVHENARANQEPSPSLPNILESENGPLRPSQLDYKCSKILGMPCAAMDGPVQKIMSFSPQFWGCFLPCGVYLYVRRFKISVPLEFMRFASRKMDVYAV